MNRSATAFTVTLAAFATAGPARAADGGAALRYSARADVALKASVDLAASGKAVRARIMHTLEKAHTMEARAAASARHTLVSGREAAVKSAGRVLLRLDAAGRSELAVLRASRDKQVQEKAAQGVDINARLTSALNVQVAQAGNGGGAASQDAAAHIIEARSHRVTGMVRGIVRARPSVRSEDARAKLDHAIAAFIDANRRTSEKLGEAAASGDDSAQPATESALEATAQSSVDIAAVIGGSESQDAQVAADGSSSGGGTTTLGELASSSSSATSAVAARAR
jgi:hypothetical protein